MHMYFIRVLLKHILVLVVLDASPVFIRYAIGSLSSTWYCRANLAPIIAFPVLT